MLRVCLIALSLNEHSLKDGDSIVHVCGSTGMGSREKVSYLQKLILICGKLCISFLLAMPIARHCDRAYTSARNTHVAPILGSAQTPPLFAEIRNARFSRKGLRIRKIQEFCDHSES